MATSMIAATNFRELFSEMPYAASLENEFLASRCATCFADGAIIPCSDDGCGNAFYCDEKCRKIDQSNHEYECIAFKKTEGEVDSFVRLLARLLTRRLSDRGVAHLSENMPGNIRSRPLGDLISHLTEIENCPYRSEKMANSLQEFGRAFSNTPLVDDWKVVKRMYCVLMANCYLIRGELSMSTGSGPPLGRGLYLNISRFDHSCCPDLDFVFTGSRMVILYPSVATDEADTVKERLALSRSSKKFYRLTVCYGYSKYYSDSFFPLRHQRRESLRFSYYFKCKCVLCSNEREAVLEEHGAPVECAECGEPYVWKEMPPRSALSCWLPPKKTSSRCWKSCSCGSDRKDLKVLGALVQDSYENLKSLELEFKSVMSFRMNDQSAEEIIDRCEPVWKKALYFWHRRANLRMSQLHERLFAAYSELVMRDWEANKTPDLHAVNMALLTGEDLVGWFQRHENRWNNPAVAACAYKLGQIYEISAATTGTVDIVGNCKRSSSWYSLAASVWRAYGGQYAAVSATQLENAAKKVEVSAWAIAQSEAKERSDADM